MPHIILEFSQDLVLDEQVSVMLESVHQATVRTALFIESHIKVRAIPVGFYLTGGNHEPFIHAQLRIKQGRNDAQKKQLSEMVLAAIVAQRWPAKVVTAEVVDMDPHSYAKWVG